MKRRSFVKKASIAVPGFYLVPRHVLGGPGFQPPSDTLRIASIGAGGVCKAYIKGCSSEKIVALCDVDDARAAETYQKFPKAPTYRDFRVMLEKEDKNIDAVIVGTPDHMHAVPAIMAMQMGKHLYCAKPLARTIYETRMMQKVAAETGVATQMSTQQNAHDDHRLVEEIITSGAIGEVIRVDMWSNRPIWPQGITRPENTPPVPDTLDWNLWLGTAPKRPYHPAYVPFTWRGWFDFGAGALGDMGCHVFDPVVKALDLGQPLRVEASSSQTYEETFPVASMVHYDFPSGAQDRRVQVTWYDGGLKPERPSELAPDAPFGTWGGGILYTGTEGKILCDDMGRKPKLLPEEKFSDYTPPEPTLPRSIGHYQEWIKAAKGGPAAGAHFGYGCPVTERVLLGNIAVRTGEVLEWDYDHMRIPNSESAQKLIHEPYHNGWKLEV